MNKKLKNIKKNYREKMKNNILEEKKRENEKISKKTVEKKRNSLIIRITIRFTIKLIIFI